MENEKTTALLEAAYQKLNADFLEHAAKLDIQNDQAVVDALQFTLGRGFDSRCIFDRLNTERALPFQVGDIVAVSGMAAYVSRSEWVLNGFRVKSISPSYSLRKLKKDGSKSDHSFYSSERTILKKVSLSDCEWSKDLGWKVKAESEVQNG